MEAESIPLFYINVILLDGYYIKQQTIKCPMCDMHIGHFIVPNLLRWFFGIDKAAQWI